MMINASDCCLGLDGNIPYCMSDQHILNNTIYSVSVFDNKYLPFNVGFPVSQVGLLHKQPNLVV